MWLWTLALSMLWQGYEDLLRRARRGELKLKGIAWYGNRLTVEANPNVGVGGPHDGAEAASTSDSITPVEGSTELSLDLLKTLRGLLVGHLGLFCGLGNTQNARCKSTDYSAGKGAGQFRRCDADYFTSACRGSAS